MSTKEQIARYDANWEKLTVNKALGTRRVLAEIADLTGPDEYGREIPLYTLIHEAFMAYRDSLKGSNSPRTFRIGTSLESLKLLILPGRPVRVNLLPGDLIDGRIAIDLAEVSI
jgi:hypothetical protein